MLHNDNEIDQLFSDRLRGHSSPVRADLWRRIHTGISTPTHRLRLPRNWRYLGAVATTITVALAAHLILTSRHPSHPSVPPVNQYSNISHSTAGRPDTASLNQTLNQTLIQPPTPTQTQTLTRNFASAPENLAHPPIPNSNFLDLHRQIQKRKQHNTTPPSGATPSPTDLATGASIHPGASTASGTSTHHSNPITLPAIASTSTRAAITIRPPILKFRHNDPNTAASTPRPIKTGYVSLYGSVDFPSNHYYTWSYTAGGTVTIQFSQHWSGTAGLEYSKLNVPTQVVPPILAFDTLHAFYWSNYEVPVLIGYTMMLGSYALTINGGAILNLYFHRSTGVWVNNWPDRDSYGAFLGTDIFRPLGHSLRVFAQPYARYSISNYRMFIPEQRFSYGALLGIRYQL